MSELRLRPATAADRDFARPIYIAATKAYTGHLPEWTDDHMAARFERRFIVEATRMAELDGLTVGWLRVTDTGAEIMLEQIYVDPAHQGRGIGSRLIRGLIQEWPGRPIRLAVLKTNPARRLYERLGFRILEEKETAYLMRREPS
jgi:ribosomal protein S18 acetylase RimI-like enzyme